MRSLVPADSLVYLETNDLAGALQPIIDSKPFNEVAKYKPDFSALKGVQLAVAITGFETSEEKVNDEQSIGKIQPRFVAIADTHAWNFQAVGFAEQKLGSFVAKIYDSEPTLERSEKNGGKYFTWKAVDGRKAFALVIDSLIYFGNDESAIDKCLAVKRGEADSIIKTGKLQSADPQTLASGYVSTDGVAQIASVIGVKIASEAAEDSEIQSAIAGIVPQVLRNSITEISWTATQKGQQSEDKFLISLLPEVASSLNEAMSPGGQANTGLFRCLPSDASMLTFYHFKNPQSAWSGLLQAAQNKVDPLSANVLAQFSSFLFEPYGVRDPETFLRAVGPDILTAFDAQETAFLITTVRNGGDVKKSSVASLSPSEGASEEGVRSWVPDNRTFFKPDEMIIGNSEGIGNCWVAGEYASDDKELLSKMGDILAPITTIGIDRDSAEVIADILSERKSDRSKANSNYRTETRFTKTGIERKTTSDFGLIGSIIAQLNEN